MSLNARPLDWMHEQERIEPRPEPTYDVVVRIYDSEMTRTMESKVITVSRERLRKMPETKALLKRFEECRNK